MTWPEAFMVAVLFISVLGYLGYCQHLRAEIMKEAIRNGAEEFKFD
jgi:hypothetical protein